MGSPSKARNIPFRSRIRYHIDNFMARGGLSVFLAVLTLFAIGFLAMAVLRLVGGFVWPDESAPHFTDGLWRTFIEIADAGNIGDDSDAPYLAKGIGILTIFVGMVLFSSMVAFITAQFEAKLEDLRRGRSEVIESGHSLILGFGDRLLDIVRELIVANESEKDAAVVVLADRDKQEMDDLLNERVPVRKTTRIITRSGAPANVASLEKVGTARARSVIILSEARSGDPDSVKAGADARVLKAIMAVIAAVGEQAVPSIVAELHLEKNRVLAESIVPGKVTTLAEDGLLAKLLVQTSRVSGLALVYSDLVGFEGNEVYFFRPPSGWPPITFGQLQYHFPESVPLGVRQASGQLALNPPASYVLRPDDDAIVLAEDDSTIGFSPTPIFTARQVPTSQRRLDTRPERHLLVGWTNKSPIIVDEYAQYLKPGSAIHIVVEDLTPQVQSEVDAIRQKYRGIDIAVAQLDITTPETLAQIVPHTYENVIILTRDQATPEEADAHTIALLLRFRQYFKARERQTGEPTRTQIITEVMDAENAELVLEVGVRDYLISNQFVSKIFAQVAQEPDVKRVYDDLFREEGSEIYLKPVELYFAQLPITLQFGDCVTAAQIRGEVCFGYKLQSEEGKADKAHGIHIIPNKAEQVTLGPGDCLMTLAENET
jgi:hypothetical protein